jgi:hypothetical protein
MDASKKTLCIMRQNDSRAYDISASRRSALEPPRMSGGCLADAPTSLPSSARTSATFQASAALVGDTGAQMAAFLDSVPPPANTGGETSKAAPRILSLTLAHGPDTAETAQEDLLALARRCSGVSRPLLIDLRMATDQSEGARLCYRHTLVHLVGPVAIVVGTNVSRFLGEFLVRALRVHHETRLFVNEERAREWLVEHV